VVTTTIPRAEIDAIMERFGDCWIHLGEVTAADVREVSASMRDHPDLLDLGDNRPASAYLAEADDLDALADCYEKMAQ
jgi:hypothetical protein